MFADDIANCAETRIRLQRQLDLIFEFCQVTNHHHHHHIRFRACFPLRTNMTVNLNKTEIIIFRNGGPLRNYESSYFNGIPVRTTSEYKYLGLIFTPKLSWSKVKRKLTAQARKAIFCIKNYQRKFGILNIKKYFVFLILWLNPSFSMVVKSGVRIVLT